MELMFKILEKRKNILYFRGRRYLEKFKENIFEVKDKSKYYYFLCL